MSFEYRLEKAEILYQAELQQMWSYPVLLVVLKFFRKKDTFKAKLKLNFAFKS